MHNRVCPECGIDLIYKTNQCRIQADKKNAKCYKCAFSKRSKMSLDEKKHCARRNTQKFNLKLHVYVWDYLSVHPCVDCGESNILFLEFDHIDEKKEWISFLIRKHASIEDIKTEINMCQVRCIGCHRKRHLATSISKYIMLKTKYTKNKSCLDCGNMNPVLLEFDHVRGEKIANVSTMLLGKFSTAAITDEINKCDIVCCNCHRVRTATRGKWKILKYINQHTKSD